MNKHEYEQLSTLQKRLYWAVTPFRPSFWKALARAWQAMRAPVQISQDEHGRIVAHPSVGTASRTLVELFKSDPKAKNFLTWRLTFAEDDGTDEEGAEWQICISRPGSVPVEDIAAVYKEALLNAGIPLPEPHRLEPGERYRIVRLSVEKGVDPRLPDCRE